jgi:hypothetical protein
MEGIINLVACTARPSLPSHMAHIAPVGFSPEAEMALEMMRWSDIPLVGYGRLVNIAQKISVSTDQLIKPSPFQALASILAAAARNEALGLGAAVKILQKRKLLPVEKQELLGENEETMQVTNFMAEMKSKKLLIHIVDDSPIGIQAGKQACSLLTGLTEGVEAKCWGVAQDQYKWRALEKVGAKVYQRSEETIRAILHEVDLARSL